MPESVPSARRFPVLRHLFSDFLAFAGKNGIKAFFLIFAGALVEGFGLILLVPLFEVVFRGHGAGGPAAGIGGGKLLFLQGLFDRLGLTSAGAELGLLVAIFAVLLLVRVSILIARDTMLARLRTGFITDLRSKVLGLLIDADWQSLSRLRHARLVHLMGTDVQQIGFAAHVFSQGVMSAVLLIIQCVLAFYLAPLLALITCALLLLGGVAMAPVVRRANALGRFITNSNLGLMHQSMQFLGGLKLAVSQNLQQGFAALFRGQLHTQCEMMVAFARQQTCNRQIVLALISLFGAVVILLGFSVLAIPPAVLIAFLVILMRMSAPASGLAGTAQQLANILPAYEKVMALSSELAPVRDGVEVKPAALPDDLTLELAHVRYIHPGSEALKGVQDLSLTLHPGDFVGIEGPSGVGKTTFADLICGLYPPESGTITIGGAPLSGAVLAAWRDKISYVAQDPFLISGTLRQNLSWMHPDLPEEKIWQALAFAGAAARVQSLPDGLDSDVGERGSLLSGGERQRIALARALIRNPALLVLDEATNAIDRPGERELLAALSGMAGRPAIVLISHRSESLSFCDRVLTMADGRFVAGVTP